MRDGNIQTLGAVEAKLLYTLHWIILDAAEECADADYEKGIYHSSPFYYLFSVPTMTVSIRIMYIVISIQLLEIYFLVVRISIRTSMSKFEGIRFSKFPFGEWLKGLATDVGISPSRCQLFYDSLQT